MADDDLRIEIVINQTRVSLWEEVDDEDDTRVQVTFSLYGPNVEHVLERLADLNTNLAASMLRAAKGEYDGR